MPMRDAKKEIITALNQLAHVKVIDDEAMVAISGIVANEINEWQSEIASQLNKQIIDWEEVHGQDDTLFTLGLRRARDLVLGASVLETLPILEKDDTVIPPEEEREDG